MGRELPFFGRWKPREPGAWPCLMDIKGSGGGLVSSRGWQSVGEGQPQCEIPEGRFCRRDWRGPGEQGLGVRAGRGCPSAWGNGRVWGKYPGFPFINKS